MKYARLKQTDMDILKLVVYEGLNESAISERITCAHKKDFTKRMVKSCIYNQLFPAFGVKNKYMLTVKARNLLGEQQSGQEI